MITQEYQRVKRKTIVCTRCPECGRVIGWADFCPCEYEGLLDSESQTGVFGGGNGWYEIWDSGELLARTQDRQLAFSLFEDDGRDDVPMLDWRWLVAGGAA